jgi:Fic family protein
MFRVERLLSLQASYNTLALQQGRAGGSLSKLVSELFLAPAINVRQAQEALGVTFAAAQSNVDKLVSLGILREVTGRERNRIYLAEEIYDAAFKEMRPEGGGVDSPAS